MDDPSPSGSCYADHTSTLFVPSYSTDEDANRFYADISAPYPNEPTRDRFKVISTDDKGEGVIALVDFSPGDIVFVFTGEVVRKQTLMTLQIKPGKYLSDPRIMGKVLHSCDPNMSCDMKTLTFTARKPIRAFDFLSMDYETTEDELFRKFHCCCGAPNCRGDIRGRKFRRAQNRKAIGKQVVIQHTL